MVKGYVCEDRAQQQLVMKSVCHTNQTFASIYKLDIGLIQLTT